jgi:inner membrane transporter RhtA
MLALRRVPARFFGVFMSVNPVFAALTGLVVLGQSLGLADWLAVAAIVTANAVSVSVGGQARGPSQRLCCTSAVVSDPGSRGGGAANRRGAARQPMRTSLVIV